MLLQFILFFFHFTISACFRFDPVGANATVGTPFNLTWHREPNDSPKFSFKLRNSSQSSDQGDPIPFTPPDNSTHDGTVTVNFPSPGQYNVEVMIQNNPSPIATSPQIYASNPESGIGPSLTTSSGSSVSVTSTSSNNPPSETISPSSTSSSSSGTSATQSSSYTAETSTTTTTLTSSSHLPDAGDAASRTSSEPPMSSSSSSNTNVTSSATGSGSLSKTPEIVGATVGSFVFLLLLLGTLVYTLFRRQHRNKYRITFHRDRMVRKRSNASFSPLTPTAKDSNTYTNFTDIEKRAFGSSIETEDTATGPEPKKECSEYSLPAPQGNRSETPSPVLAHTDRQMELHDVLVKQQTELIRLKTELRRGVDVQDEIDVLKARIVGLEDALKSSWALGYTDDVPVEVSRVLVLM